MNKDLGPHADNHIKFVTEKAVLNDEQIKEVRGIEKKLNIQQNGESVPTDVKIIKPHEFEKYNISIPTDLEIINEGKELAKHNMPIQEILGKTAESNCCNTSFCHDDPGPYEGRGWSWWSEISGILIK